MTDENLCHIISILAQREESLRTRLASAAERHDSFEFWSYVAQLSENMQCQIDLLSDRALRAGP